MRALLLLPAILAGCTHPPDLLFPAPPPQDPPALRVAARLLDARLDTYAQGEPSSLVLLALIGPDASGKDASPALHRADDLKVLRLTYGYQGLCRPPEAACFRGDPGYLLRMSLPAQIGEDSTVVWAEIARYRPDPRRPWPANLGLRPGPPGDGPGPCPWEIVGGRILLTREAGPRWVEGPELLNTKTLTLCRAAG